MLCSVKSYKPTQKSIFNIYNPKGSKLLNRLKLGFNHLSKFCHNFAHTVSLLWSCALETEVANHVSLHTALINESSSINSEIVYLLYGDKKLNDNPNHQILQLSNISQIHNDFIYQTTINLLVYSDYSKEATI